MSVESASVEIKSDLTVEIVQEDQGQHMGVLRVWSFGGIFWAGIRELHPPGAAGGNQLAPTRALECSTGCQSQALGSCPSLPVVSLWDCWAPGPSSCAMPQAAPGWRGRLQSEDLLKCVDVSQSLFLAGCREQLHLDIAGGTHLVPHGCRGCYHSPVPPNCSRVLLLLPPGWGHLGQGALSCYGSL